ncbi:MAG: universal stress protein [Proteobacteria bacterium]|nr:universal stress protein [Pseudomonadota bacterium]
MGKHLLVTVSEDGSALKGIQFIQGFFEHREALHLTLFYTAPKPRMVWIDGEFFEAMSEFDHTVHQVRKVGRKSLDAALALLAECGFSDGQVNSRLRLREVSTAKDILGEGEKKQYDAIVLGRRGAHRLQELVEASVTEQLLDRQLTVPLWICREPAPGRRNVLLCLDGSEASLRMVDHVGCMLADEPVHGLSLLHVSGNGLFTAASTASIYAQAREILVQNGVDESRINEVHVEPASVSGAIIAEVRAGNYAVVATGSAGRGPLGRAFLGSVVRDLMARLTGAVLWVSA